MHAAGLAMTLVTLSAMDTKGLPAFYQNTFHSDKYIIEIWTRYFDVRRIARRSITQHQDFVVGQKR